MILLRSFICGLLLISGLASRASDAILPVPPAGVSARVTQPHVTAELISEKINIEAGRAFDVILHLHMDPDWHTYWINPGGAGIPTEIKWTLPPGFTAGPIQWPTPENHTMGGIVTYGYAGDVYLLTTITPPAQFSGPSASEVEIKAHAEWLVCKEECIPGKADLALKVAFGGKIHDQKMPASNEALFKAARARLPIQNSAWKIEAAYHHEGAASMQIKLSGRDAPGFKWGQLYFFPEQTNVLSGDPKDVHQESAAGSEATLTIALAQNGETPDHLSGVLVSDKNPQAVYLSRFPVRGASAGDAAGSVATTVAPPNPPPSDQRPSGDGGHRPPLQGEQPLLLAILGGAFLGGLILNLMPCVLPVLSLKVFSLVKHAGNDPRSAWKQGAAFTFGVVISFWILAGLLIALRAAGSHLGWGFQMQSPGFVLALIFLFFLLGLNLFGVFELGTSLVGLDAKTTGRVSNGLTSSFLNGALATLAATPCTAPFMGSSVGFAAEQPAWVAMLIFTVLALGMATPYLLLTIFPAALRFVPKPGAWMEAFRQFMGFLLMATVIFLLYVFGALVGQGQVPYLLAALLLAGVGVWIYGKWATPIRTLGTRFVAVLLALVAVGYAVWWSADLARATPPEISTTMADGWRPWTANAVSQTLAKGQPVFVDFTAAWCLSCKVNESVALEKTDVMAAFKKKNVALFRADWTHSDPAISDILARYHRDGVPLYLLYSPTAKDSPIILPAVLTPGLVEDAIAKLP